MHLNHIITYYLQVKNIYISSIKNKAFIFMGTYYLLVLFAVTPPLFCWRVEAYNKFSKLFREGYLERNK